MEDLFQNINRFVTLGEEELSELFKIISFKKHEVGTILCDIGNLPTKIYFIKSGIVRGYAMSKKGTSYNKTLFTQNEFMASLSALLKKTKAEIALECLTDCEVYEANYYTFIDLCKKYPNFIWIYNKVLEEYQLG